MFTRPIRFALLLTCAVAALTCCEVRGQACPGPTCAIGGGPDYVPGSSAIFTMSIDPPFGSGLPSTMSLLSSDFYITRLTEVGAPGPGNYIPTEIKDLTLRGLHPDPAVGQVTVRIGAQNTNDNTAISPVLAGATDGAITGVVSTRLTGSTTDFVTGLSEFGVLFEVDLFGGQTMGGITLYNRPTDPHELRVQIFDLPPIGSNHLPFGSPPFVNLWRRVGLSNNQTLDPHFGIAYGTHLLLPFDPTVPEPASLVLLGIGCVGFVSYRRRS